MNSFTSNNLRGAQVFYSTGNPESEKLATSVQQIFSLTLPESDKGSAVGDYYILKCTNIPTILCECGYLSNVEDEQLLIDDMYQEKVAFAIYKGIILYLNVGNHVM